MRDVVAGILAVLLIVVALSLATTLRRYRQGRERARDSERALGRTIVAELPTADDLVLFSEDRARFYYGERSIDKDLITAVRVLINGAPLATVVSERHARRWRASLRRQRSGASGRRARPGADCRPHRQPAGGYRARSVGCGDRHRHAAPSWSNAARSVSASRRSWRDRCSTP